MTLEEEYQDALKGNYPGHPSQVKRRTVTAALFELRKTLVALD